MVKDGIRVCDACGDTIPNGTTYAVHTFPKDEAELVRSLTERSPDTAPTFTVDSDGSMRLDIYLNCKANMGMPGEIVD